MSTRRGFLQALTAIAAAPALIQIPDLRIIDAGALILPAEMWFGSVRESKGYDSFMDRTIYRWDLMGQNEKGEIVQLAADFMGNTDAQYRQGREAATLLLRDGMKFHRIDPRKLKPLPESMNA